MRLIEDALDVPLRWRRPRRIFVNSMSDLFHEAVPDAWIDEIYSVMARAAPHTFQVLTKRPERMLDYFAHHSYALPHVWLGVSVENQATADERIPLLLKTPAAVRWVSYEPALGPVDFRPWLACDFGGTQKCGGPYLNWMVVGGESGPRARPFRLEWAYHTIAQGRQAGVPIFIKQLGRHVHPEGLDTCFAYCLGPGAAYTNDRKGGDPSEWPDDLRVREYPPCATPAS